MDQNIRLPDFFVYPRVSLHPNLHILHIAVCQHTFNMYTPTSSQAQNFDFDMVDVRLYWSECPFTLFLCFYKVISYPILHGSPAAKFRCRCKQSANVPYYHKTHLWFLSTTYIIIITFLGGSLKRSCLRFGIKFSSKSKNWILSCNSIWVKRNCGVEGHFSVPVWVRRTLAGISDWPKLDNILETHYGLLWITLKGSSKYTYIILETPLRHFWNTFETKPSGRFIWQLSDD